MSKCRYCDFNSYAWTGQELDRYVRALLREAELRAEALHPQTVFIGGGTPTFLPADLLAELLVELSRITGFRSTAHEVTIEANPESFDEPRAQAAAQGGVNRVSLGVQSLRPEVLRAYDRVHSGERALEALARARELFTRFSADLIFAFPGQDPASWEADLRAVLASKPGHVSCYELSYEPGTALTRLRNAGRWKAEDSDLCEELYLRTGKILAEHVYERYETSNFARPGERCLHNLAAWRNLHYVGVGAGAASWHGGARRKNIERPEAYQAAVESGIDPVGECERPDANTALFDHLMMGLRLVGEGVSRARVRAATGLDPVDHFANQWQAMREDGWVEWDAHYLRTTARGALLLDSVLTRLLPGEPV
ncbi:MAG: radical SAM family heme chaperone HemW [Planctomycetes bacterium]|nr:radical SAM family heme chaperone HemW [Planctomycetota bacterium]